MIADSLSRVFFMAWSEPVPSLLQELRKEVAHNVQLQALVRECQEESQGHSHYTDRDGVLLWKGRIVLAANNTLIEKILQEYHSSAFTDWRSCR